MNRTAVILASGLDLVLRNTQNIFQKDLSTIKVYL